MTDGPVVGGTGPHAGQPILTAGAPKEAADAALVLLHGRGARPSSMLDLADELDRSGVAHIAPEASHSTWYPNSFMADRGENQPHLDSALQAADDAVEVALEAGVSRENILVLGFSQGACLASEYVYRNPARYGGMAALSGGLIGPDGMTWPDADEQRLENTPALFGCDDADPHIPESRVHESADAYRKRGADVTKQLYEGVGHTIVDDEIDWLRETIDDLLE